MTLAVGGGVGWWWWWGKKETEPQSSSKQCSVSDFGLVLSSSSQTILSFPSSATISPLDHITINTKLFFPLPITKIGEKLDRSFHTHLKLHYI